MSSSKMNSALFFVKGEVGEPGQKGGKGSKGEHVRKLAFI